MQIICIEEHCIDPDIEQACRSQVGRQAPYMQYLQLPGPAAKHISSTSHQEQKLTQPPCLDESRIAQMDRCGIDVQIVSYSSPTQFAPTTEIAELAAKANDRLALSCQRFPGRFYGFATLPWQDPTAATAELERAVHSLGMKGAMIIGRPGDSFLDDVRYTPVLQKFSDLNVPLYVHPFAPMLSVQESYYAGLDPAISAAFSLGGWGWHHEAGIQILRMLLCGLFDRLPQLQVISGHWGEMVPFFLHRLDQAIPQQVTGLSRSITDTYKEHVWITPSGMLDHAQFNFVQSVVGSDRVIWSCDYPYVPMEHVRSFIESLSVPESVRLSMASGNARALFGI